MRRQPPDFGDSLGLRHFRLVDSLSALGAASLFLADAPPFNTGGFGLWVSTLQGQILRQHYFFTDREVETPMGKQRQIVGYCGWALTSRETAEDWVNNRRLIDMEECRSGPYVLVMAVRAIEDGVYPIQSQVMRHLHGDQEFTYWQRITEKGLRTVKFNLQSSSVKRPRVEVPIVTIGAR